MRHLEIRQFLRPPGWAHYARSQIGPSRANLHDHDFHELFWIEAGRGTLLTPAFQIALGIGDLCLVHASDCHGFTTPPGSTMLLTNLAIPVARWEELAGRYGGDDPMRWSASRRRRRLGPDDLGALRLAAADLDRGLRDRLAVERVLLTVLGLLREAPPDPDLPEWLAPALAALEAGRWREGTHALVALSGRSREHVARVVRAHLGTTPTALVTQARLRHIARRLTETDLPVQDLAAETGLSNLAHLYRLFRRAYGVSPGAWRRRHQQAVTDLTGG